MNVYQIMTNHYAPKDSHKAIWRYLIASSSEEVYEWMKSEPAISDDFGSLFLCWADWEYDDEEEELDSDEKFKTQMIDRQNEEETDKANYDDLYYGRTFVSWEKVCENIGTMEIEILKKSGIRIFDVNEKSEME